MCVCVCMCVRICDFWRLTRRPSISKKQLHSLMCMRQPIPINFVSGL